MTCKNNGFLFTTPNIYIHTYIVYIKKYREGRREREREKEWEEGRGTGEGDKNLWMSKSNLFEKSTKCLNKYIIFVHNTNYEHIMKNTHYTNSTIHMRVVDSLSSFWISLKKLRSQND